MPESIDIKRAPVRGALIWQSCVCGRGSAGSSQLGAPPRWGRPHIDIRNHELAAASDAVGLGRVQGPHYATSFSGVQLHGGCWVLVPLNK